MRVCGSARRGDCVCWYACARACVRDVRSYVVVYVMYVRVCGEIVCVPLCVHVGVFCVVDLCVRVCGSARRCYVCVGMRACVRVCV